MASSFFFLLLLSILFFLKVFDEVLVSDSGCGEQVLVPTIRAEIASCSEKAYPSLPIANAKSLLFLESEGAVVEFSRERGWVVRDGRIYFPVAEEVEGGEGGLVRSGAVIENTIGYARELETIV